MVETRSVEIKVEALTQVGFAVKDAERTAQNYWHILGIGPWGMVTMQTARGRGTTYRGKPAYYDMKGGEAQVGPVRLELCETLEGCTIYSDFVTEHGEGAHHLQNIVDNMDIADKHAEIMAKKGFPFLMGGYFGNKGGYDYFDTASALGTIWESVVYPTADIGPIVRYPANEAEVSPAKVKVKAVTQICIAVKNLQETMENYWNIFGIGPWDVVECVPPTLHDITYYGKPGNYTMRSGVARVGEVNLELIQPVSGDSIYRDFICKYGEGIQSIQFLVDDIDEITRIMNQEGFPTLMSGGFSDGAFAYYDTVGPLKTTWEAFQKPKTMPPMTRYP